MCSLIALKRYNLKYNYSFTVTLIDPYGIVSTTAWVSYYGIVLNFNLSNVKKIGIMIEFIRLVILMITLKSICIAQEWLNTFA